MNSNVYSKQLINHINNHINDLKEKYILLDDDTNKTKYNKLVAHKLFLEQKTKGIQSLFNYLIKKNPMNIITEFENVDYPECFMPSIISVYINEFYTEHADLIDKLLLLNQYHLIKYKKSWKYLDNEDENFFENFYEIINKIETIKSNEELQKLIIEINNI